MASSFDGGVAREDSIHKNGGSALNGGYRPTHTPGRTDNPMVTVQPPRREDLQPSYAQTLLGESELGNNGWYGSMSEYPHATVR
jgi:erythrocyte band 7 integral membrane protein